MKARTALAIGIRLLGLFLIVQVVRGLPGLVSTLDLASKKLMLFPYWIVAPWAAGLGAAFVLLRFADAIARRLVASDEDIALEGCHEPSVQRAAFQCGLKILGAVLVARSMVGIVRCSVALGTVQAAVATGWVEGRGYVGARWFMGAEHFVDSVSGLMSGLLGLGIGIYLLKGGGLLVRLAYAAPGGSKDEGHQ